MSDFSRRQFLHDSLFAAAAATAGSANSLLAGEASTSSEPKGPNEKLGFCVMGVHGQGGSHIESLLNTNNRGDADIVAICDVDQLVGNTFCDEIEKRVGRRPKYFQDIRMMLEDKSIDCVSMATPNHWHALGAIWAMQHGKDVYVEKPASHNVSEGRRMVETARAHKRICQTGTQCRSQVANHEAINYIHSGKIGDVKLAHGLCYRGRDSIGPKGEYAVPAHIDYDLWCGPAARWKASPYASKKYDGAPHYDWHWVWNTGNGDLGNQGIHQMDLCRWALGLDTLPQGVISYGGRFGYFDAGETPNTEVIVLDYGPKTLVFEVRGLKTKPYKGAGVGIVVEGSEGYVVMTAYAKGAAFGDDGKVVLRFEGSGDHHSNFIKAVRSRQKEDLNADILEGHLSSALCHLGNISYRLGNPMSTEEAIDRLRVVKTSDNTQNTMNRTIEHLSQNGVQLDGATQFRCGEYLKFDVRNETFPGNTAATEMCSREYRKGFEVPAAGKV